MKAFVIEDDDFCREELGDLLRSRFPVLLVENMDCVSVFEAHFETFAQCPPELVILDIMLPWARVRTSGDKSSNIDAAGPSDFDPHRSGMRILQMMSDDPRTCRVPIVILSAALDSVLREGATFSTNVIGLRKPATSELILQSVKALTFGRLHEAPHDLSGRLKNALEVKPGWFGITFDVKKLMRF